MTYRLAGNDPTRTRDIPTPDEVRAMITGAGSDGFQAANRFSEGVSATLEHEAAAREGPDEIMVWLDGERPMDESLRLGALAGRCGSCGRKFDCCCAGCTTCPQRRMAPGKISTAWATRMNQLGDSDPQEA